MQSKEFKTCIVEIYHDSSTLFGLQLLPRIYPQGFAEFIKDLHPDVIKGVEGVPKTDPNSSAEQMFYNQPFSTWEEAKIIPVLKYVRGNKHLRAPASWVAVFPEPFEVLHRLGL